jgi:VanZ family protein
MAVVAGIVLALRPAPEHPEPWFAHADKVQHGVAFAVLFGLGWLGQLRPLARLCAGLLLLGAAIEVAQSFTATRTAEWADLLADAVGIAIGALAAAWAEPRLGSLPEKDRGQAVVD